MIWMYARSGESLEVETRFDNATQQYQLLVRWPTGEHWRESFQDVNAFRRRLRELSAELEDAEWSHDGNPIVVPEGWRRPPVN